MSDIPSLTSKAQRLNGDVDLWNSVIVWAMIVAAAAATVLVVSQYVAFRKAKALTEVQQKLSEAKEQANKETIAGLQRDTALALAEAEKERLERVKIEEKLKPRRMSHPEAIGADLKRFSGQQVNIKTHGGDQEIADLGRDIEILLSSKGWKVGTISGIAPMGKDSGIIIEVPQNSPDTAKRAAAVLADVLRGERLEVKGPVAESSQSRVTFGGTIRGAVFADDVITVSIARKP